jgi:hypothetical protein
VAAAPARGGEEAAKGLAVDRRRLRGPDQRHDRRRAGSKGTSVTTSSTADVFRANVDGITIIGSTK